MLPGPDLIKKCPHCGKLAKQRTIASGNNLGAQYWTDGWFFAPMLPQTPQLVDCPNCGKTAWQSDFQEVDRSPSGLQASFLIRDAVDDELPLSQSAKEKLDKRERYKDIAHLEETSADGIERFLGASEMLLNDEITARILLWRKWNNRRRSTPEMFPLDANETKNLERLLQLLHQSNDGQFILIAEVSRQLKRFDTAQTCLSLVTGSDHYEAMKHAISSAVVLEDHHLRAVRA